MTNATNSFQIVSNLTGEVLTTVPFTKGACKRIIKAVKATGGRKDLVIKPISA